MVETQALSMRRFSEWIGHAPKQLVLTGGAARNAGIQRIVADVFQCPVRTLRVNNASALGTGTVTITPGHMLEKRRRRAGRTM